MKLFLSYRRNDVGGHAGRLYDALVGRLGRRKVFHDVSAIGAGRPWRDVIDDELASCDAVLAVIGPGWLRATAADGSRRLADPDDLVRRELAAALHRGVPVVPVLVGGAQLPSADELPEPLVGLSSRQSHVLSDETFHGDVRLLLRSLRGAPWWSDRRLVAAGLAAALLLGGGTWWRLRPAPDEGLTGCPGTTGQQWRDVALDGRPSSVLEDGDGEVEVHVLSARWRPADPDGYDLVLLTEMENRSSRARPHEPDLYRDVVVARRAFDPSCFDLSRDQDPAPGQVADARVGFAVACKPHEALELGLAAPASQDRTALGLTAASTAGTCDTGASAD